MDLRRYKLFGRFLSSPSSSSTIIASPTRMTTPNPSPRPSTCEAIKGCPLPIDVVLQSSDGRLLGAHSKNLQWFAEGFPLSGSTSPSEVVPLSETGDTLLLFLKFVHNHPAPDLSVLEIDELLDFAEMANKYCNYFALATCRKSMSMLANESMQNALKILRFKAVHRDLEGIDEIAAKTMSMPIVDVLKFFGKNHIQEFVIWLDKLQYQQEWVEFIAEYHSHIQIMHFDCSGDPISWACPDTKSIVANQEANLKEGFPSLRRFDSAFNGPNPCSSQDGCQALQKWKEAVRSVLQTAPSWQQLSLWE
ncbi:hypothetical protein L218DRAFT_1080472 [Marasmius fiardii PR-910]|nr:hypothetical protein L218DRAFT_1080472 [Marasmius fiardii PR-910]